MFRRICCIALFLIPGYAAPKSVCAQADPLEDYDRYLRRVTPGILWTEIGLSTVYDTNIEQSSSGIAGPGLIGDFHAQLRTSTYRPLVRIDYFGRVQQYRTSEAWNRETHTLNAVLERRIGPVGLEAIGSWQINNQTEDREIADAFLLSPRISLRFQTGRVRVYGRHWARDFERDGRKETIRTVGGDIRWSPFARLDLELGLRHEEGDSDLSRSRFIRKSVSSRSRLRLTERTKLVLEASRRSRIYPERLVEVVGGDSPTRDVRWIPAVFLSQGRSPGPEMRIGYEYQSRRSNDSRRDYEAHRTFLSFRFPFAGWNRGQPSRRSSAEEGSTIEETSGKDYPPGGKKY